MTPANQLIYPVKTCVHNITMGIDGLAVEQNGFAFSNLKFAWKEMFLVQSPRNGTFMSFGFNVVSQN